MAITVKHKFVSAIPDAGDTTIVQPSNWNDDHQLSGTVPVANGGTGASTLTGYVKGNGTSAMTASTTVPNTDVTGLGTASTKDAGVANGVATLDSSGQVPLSQIPPLGDLNYQGTWNATTNSPTLTSSVGTKGFYYVVSVAGTTNLNGITDWQIGDWAVFNGSAWQKIDNTDAVTSVNGYTGTVVLNAADVGAVPYTGATGAVDLNAKTLVNVSNLGVNTTTVPTIKIRAVGDNNSSSRIAMRGYSSDANSSAIRVSKFRGTVAAPQAPLSGDSLGKFELAGYGTTSADAYPQSSLEGVATENWGATARGAKAVVKVTPNTTITQVTALTIDQDSKATFANTVTANGVLLTGNTGTVTSVAATAGTGISVSGSPITTSGTLTITNTAPDQTVALTAGTGISTSGTYPNFTITNTAPSSGGTVTSVTGTAPVVSSGGNTPAISMAAATGSVNGYLTSTDWTTFNNKSNTNGTVTSVAALTLGTTGTDLSSTVANSTTTPVITLNVPTASATNRGALSSTDWTTFNNKANAFTYTSNYIPYGQGTTTPAQSAGLQFNGTTLTTANDASISGLTVGKGGGAVSTNTAFGVSALSSNTSGNANVGIGNQAGYSNTTGIGCTFLGYQAGYASNSTYGNTFIGYKVGYQATGGGNTIVGGIGNTGSDQAGASLTTGTSNSFFGTSSGNAVTTGSKNSILGAYSGNQGGLDIRTASNYIVLSDGDGNPQATMYQGGSLALSGATPKAGSGVTFPATQSASTDANTLDDYEEGTWTPIITSTGGGSGQTYGTQEGKYTKIGNQVTVSFNVTLSNAGTLTSGVARLGGLPFAFTEGNTGITFSYWSGVSVNIYALYGSALSGQTQMDLLYQTAAAGAVNSGFPVGSVSNSFRMQGNITYLI